MGNSQEETSELAEDTSLRDRVTDLEDKWKRAVADYKNLERRTKTEREEFTKFANTVLILKVLPVLDDLERAIDAGADEGVKNIAEKFREVLKSEGVVEIEASGKEFDPECMEGVEAELQPGGEEKVIEVVEKGYRIGERVIRPAKVKVK